MARTFRKTRSRSRQMRCYICRKLRLLSRRWGRPCRRCQSRLLQQGFLPRSLLQVRTRRQCAQFLAAFAKFKRLSHAKATGQGAGFDLADNADFDLADKEQALGGSEETEWPEWEEDVLTTTGKGADHELADEQALGGSAETELEEWEENVPTAGGIKHIEQAEQTQASAGNGGPPPRGRPFRKGVSGNPAGRPKGSRNRMTYMAEAILEENTPDLMNVAVEAGRRGNEKMLRILLPIILGASRERPIQIPLQLPRTADDTNDVLWAILSQAYNGTITFEEAKKAMDLYKSTVDLVH
jgi:hypothetical protein